VTIVRGRNFLSLGGCQNGAGGGICALVSSGGALTLTLNRVVLQGNQATVAGGGLAADAVDVGSSLNVTVTDSTVIGNAAGFGGGMEFDTDVADPAAHVILDGVLITRNRAAAVHGLIPPTAGGVFLGFNGQNGQAEIRNTRFERNVARSADEFEGVVGGLDAETPGCQMGSCPVRVVNTVFQGNRAVASGAMLARGAELVNVTATRNHASMPRSRGAGVGGVVLDSGTVLNSILWGNLAPDSPRDLLAHTMVGVGLDHSDILDQSGPVTDLGGNISANPLFVVGDIHLRAGSPCIDTGTCTGAPTTDFEGDPRPTGAGCDMGADEFVP